MSTGEGGAALAGVRIVPDADGMERLGRDLGALLVAGDLVVLTGPLGAGKTTLTRGIGEGLHVRGPVTSPTFVLARTHPSPTGGPSLVHVDAYRLGSALELDDLDIDFAGSVVVVEWGSGMLDGVAESWLDVEIERPTGAGVSADGAADGPSVSPGAVADTGARAVDAAAGLDAADDSSRIGGESDADAVPEEPRTVTITPHGPRWE